MEKVGVFISRIFAHGQLYVALSRAQIANGLKILIQSGDKKVANIVYPEIL